jgi:hypothetical protein
VRRFYCRKRPQYVCVPVSQHPLFMQMALRWPQLVMHMGKAALVALWLQAAMQVFSSPLQRMAAACAGPVPHTASIETRAMQNLKGMRVVLRCAPPIESETALFPE